MNFYFQTLLPTTMLEPARVQSARQGEISVYVLNTSVLLINGVHLIEKSSKDNKHGLQQTSAPTTLCLWNHFCNYCGLLQCA